MTTLSHLSSVFLASNVRTIGNYFWRDVQSVNEWFPCKFSSCCFSPSPRTSTHTSSCGQRRRGQSLSQEAAEPDTPLNYPQTPPQTMKSMGSGPLTPRVQLGSRPHTPVGRVDIRPQDDLLLSPQSIGSAPPSPRLDFSPCSLTPTTEKRHTLNRVSITVNTGVWFGRWE